MMSAVFYLLSFTTLLKELVEDFVFPASKIVLQSRKLNGEFPTDEATPVCTSPATVIAAYDLLVALCTGCVPNLRSLAAMLIDMYHSGERIKKIIHNAMLYTICDAPGERT